MERTLLLVDDEQNIVSALKRLFRRDNYTILTANSGPEALEILKDNTVGVVISDQRMPEMNGVELLSKIKDSNPETVRIMLSGYTDLKSVTDAINEGAIYKFLTKPWDDELLKENVKVAFRHFELVSENERLSLELKKANEELSCMNQQLTTDMDLTTHEVNINHRALKLSQDILECLPIGIIGLGNDGIIAMANRKAYEILAPGGGALLGHSADEVFPEEVKIHQNQKNDENGLHCLNKIEVNNCAVFINSYPLQSDGEVHGSIIVLMFDEVNQQNMGKE